jgi:NADH-quinone oxidoreductase subunit L
LSLVWADALTAFLLLAPMGMFLLTLVFRLKNNENFSPVLQRCVNLVQGALCLAAITLFYSVFFEELLYDQTLFAWFKHSEQIYTYTVHLDFMNVSFLVLVTFISAIIGSFSNNYLANEAGYYKFFMNFYVMQLALYSLTLSSNFYFILVSWELLGLSSVFLVSFYQGMRKTVANALFVLGIYKFCDLFLITALLMFHHEQHVFVIPHALPNALPHAAPHVSTAFLTLLWISSLGKSGQFPFSKWLPRAMEGPTTSSAIFYGALSIHAGLFLLLKFRLFFSENNALSFYIGAMGMLTFTYALLKGRIQTDVKATLAYATVAQVGLMYLEFALGLYSVVIFHMAANAILKSYQFLRSPSNIHHFHDLEKLNYRSLAPWGRLFYAFPQKIRVRLYQMVYHNFGLTLIWERLQHPVKLVFERLQQISDDQMSKLERLPWISHSRILMIAMPMVGLLLYMEVSHPSFAFYFTASFLLGALVFSVLSLKHSTIAHYLTYIKWSYFCLSAAALLFFGPFSNLDAIAYFVTNFFALLILEVFIRYLSDRLVLSDIRRYLGVGLRYRYMNMLGMVILLLLTFTPGFAGFVVFDLVLEAFFEKSMALMFVFLAINTLNAYSVFCFVFKIMFGEPLQSLREYPDFTRYERMKLFLLIFPMILMGLLPFLIYH